MPSKEQREALKKVNFGMWPSVVKLHLVYSSRIQDAMHDKPFFALLVHNAIEKYCVMDWGLTEKRQRGKNNVAVWYRHGRAIATYEGGIAITTEHGGKQTQILLCEEVI